MKPSSNSHLIYPRHCIILVDGGAPFPAALQCQCNQREITDHQRRNSPNKAVSVQQARKNEKTPAHLHSQNESQGKKRPQITARGAVTPKAQP